MLIRETQSKKLGQCEDKVITQWQYKLNKTASGTMPLVCKGVATPSIVSISMRPSTNAPCGHIPAQLLVGRTAHNPPSAEV